MLCTFSCLVISKLGEAIEWVQLQALYTKYKQLELWDKEGFGTSGHHTQPSHAALNAKELGELAQLSGAVTTTPVKKKEDISITWKQ